jgi:hypothetical protein
MTHVGSYPDSDASADRRNRRPVSPMLASGRGQDHTLAADIASASAPQVVIYIDKQRLGRDCVGERLASHLPG